MHNHMSVLKLSGNRSPDNKSDFAGSQAQGTGCRPPALSILSMQEAITDPCPAARQLPAQPRAWPPPSPLNGGSPTSAGILPGWKGEKQKKMPQIQWRVFCKPTRKHHPNPTNQVFHSQFVMRQTVVTFSLRKYFTEWKIWRPMGKK